MVRGTKRDAAQVTPSTIKIAATPIPPEKKLKGNDLLIAAVNEALNKAGGLPEMCRTMLMEAAPRCLTTPSNQRGELQESLVGMIGNVLDGIQTKMQEAIDADNTKISEAETTKHEYEGKAKAAEAVLTERTEEVAAKELALDRASQVLLDAKDKFANAQSAQSAGDAVLVDLESDKKVVLEALGEHVSALKEDDGWEASGADKHLDVLLLLAKRFGFDESLISALPTACNKKPSDRGCFDVTVIYQLEVSLNNRVAKLSESLSSEAPASAERAATVAAMHKVLQEANEEHQRAATELSTAQTMHHEAISMLQAAEAKSNAYLPEYTCLIAEKEEKVSELHNFQNYNMLCFTTLRNQMPKKIEPMLTCIEAHDLASAGA